MGSIDLEYHAFQRGVEGVLDKNVALFIDYENVYWSLKNSYACVPQPGHLVDIIKQEAQKEGQLVLMLAYADFDQTEFKGLQTELQRRSVEPRHVFSKSLSEGIRKNAADIELSLDALELVYTRNDIDSYVLVCGDRDLIQLIRKLHMHSKKVSVIGVEKTTSYDLTMFADAFIALEPLLGMDVDQSTCSEQDDDMIALIQRLEALEEGSLPFVGLKMLINRLLTGIDNPQMIINQAIGEEVVLTYAVPNPHKPEFPTTAVRLNYENHLVQHVLGAEKQSLWELTV